MLLILLGVMAYKLVEVYGDLSAAKEQEARLHAQVEQKEEANNSLKDALSHADDPDYILGLARDQGWRRTASASFGSTEHPHFNTEGSQ